MKQIITCLVLLFLVSCDETVDYLRQLNEAPQINFTNNPDVPVLADSIKLGPYSSQEKYTISLRVTDKNQNVSEIIYTQLAGTGKLKQDNIDIVSNNITFRQDSTQLLQFDYYPANLGVHKIGLQAVDRFGLKNSVTIEITAFENLPPISKVSWTKTGERGRYHYEIRTNESFDKDARFGGKVVEYEYKTQGVIHQILGTTDGATKYQVIFPQKGIYPIEVRVRDNDQKWSEPFKDEIVVD